MSPQRYHIWKRYYDSHRPQLRAYQRGWRKKNPNYDKNWNIAHPGARFAWGLKQKFGLTLDKFQKMFLNQRGHCKICGNLPDKRGLSVDHDHRTGQVRGLLCFRCNAALGGFSDSVRLLKKAIQYLQIFSGKVLVK